MDYLEVKDLSKSFDRKLAVHNVSFRVEPGTVTGLLGPNGAGKTTTMRLLTGFLAADSGSVFYGEKNLDSHLPEIRRSLGYLPESAPIYPDMTIFEYLHFMAEARMVPSSQKNKKVAEMVEVCELSSHLHRPIGTLSKGFRQRTALASTLVHDPAFIILDEPTSGLDPNQMVQIRRLIQTLSKEKTILLSTHILQEIEEICDKVIIVNQGKVVADSSVSDLNRLDSVLLEAKTDLDTIQKVYPNHKIEQLGSQEPYSKFRIHLNGQEASEAFEAIRNSNLVVREFSPEKARIASIFEELTHGK